jgi:hypothetical protein
MKVTIAIKKTDPFKKLFVRTVEKEMYDAIVARLQKNNASPERIETFIKPNDYKGKISYQFDLNCSSKTWLAVERYAELDAKIDFGINEKGYCFAKINIEEGIEQVLEYTPPVSTDDNVTEWACGAIPEAKKEAVIAKAELPIAPEDETTDLPF